MFLMVILYNLILFLKSMLLSERDKRKLAANTAAMNVRKVHFKDTRAGLNWGKGSAALWEKAVKAVRQEAGRRDPLGTKSGGPVYQPGNWDIDSKRFWAMRDNPTDIEATSNDFAPIAKARRAREKIERAAAAVKATAKAAVALTWTRSEFERNLYVGQAVEAVFQQPTEDGMFHYFPATVVGGWAPAFSTGLVHVKVKWPNPMGGRPSIGFVYTSDVRTPMPNLTGHSLAERQFANKIPNPPPLPRLDW
jgi:hypothetical protein